MIALDCRSYSKMSRGTHGRDWLRPYGNQGYTFVHEGNVLGCRVALFLLVASWRSLVWVLEQPHGSALPDLPRMQFLWSVVQVYTTYFYMGLFKGATPKRHRVWTNVRRLAEALSTRAGYMSRAEQTACAGQTVKKYTDARGVKRCVGLKKELKESQYQN
ncbi:unnamed protein product [Durusdinium trenchii]|uniref:Very-long-chain 3-oxoacyl-CoA synthase n=1 Tax=Durusdinium trenchii TaxID=1381693 RepID=A0ABP0QKD4_9DINO